MMQLPIKTVAIYFVDWDLISLNLGVMEYFQVIAYTAALIIFFFLIQLSALLVFCIQN